MHSNLQPNLVQRSYSQPVELSAAAPSTALPPVARSRSYMVTSQRSTTSLHFIGTLLEGINPVLTRAPSGRYLFSFVVAQADMLGAVSRSFTRNKVHIAPADQFGIETTIINPKNLKHTNACIFRCHGGANIIGGSSHYLADDALAEKTGIPVFTPRYTRQKTYPSALYELKNAYQKLIKTYHRKNVVLVGDSFGGLLVLHLLSHLRKDEMPGLVILQSAVFDPKIDTTQTSREWLPKDKLQVLWELFGYAKPDLKRLDRKKFAETSIRIRVGTHELLLHQARRWAQMLTEAGLKVELEEWQNHFHWSDALGSLTHFSDEILSADAKHINEYLDQGETKNAQ